MRSSEAIPQSFVRPKLNQRPCVQVQPLWMRVLEEKYQKLQLKIAQSTATMNGLYNAPIGRSVYDNKIVRASIPRTKERPSFRKRPPKYEIKSTRISATHISTNSELQKTTSEINDRLLGDDKSVGRSDKSINDPNVRVSEILYLRYDKHKPHKKDLAEILKSHGRKVNSNSNGKESSNNMKKSELRTERNNNGNYSDAVSKVNSSSQLTGDYTSSRHSLATQQTTVSCPVNITDFSGNVQSKSRAESAGQKRINRRKMKMFSRMSAEAQTALTETILENESERNIESEDEDDNLNENLGTDCGLSLADVKDVTGRDDVNDSEVSMPSRDSRSIHTKLPDIPNEGQEYLTLRSLQPTDGKVPGIGKFPFPSKKEATFEITPPGFDIRYKDAPIREERESETPPPDIRDRAIRKCQDWLTRYTPRTPRPSQTANT